MRAPVCRVPRWLLRHRWGVLGVTAVLLAASAWAAGHLRLDADMLSLLREDDPALVAYRRVEASQPLLGALFVVLDAGASDRTTAVSDAIAEIASLDNVSTAIHLPVLHEGESVVMAALSSPGTDIDASERAIAEVSAVLDRHDLKGEFTGSPAFLSESRALMTRDLGRAGLITAIGVALFFLLVHRSGVLVLLALVPIGAGIVLGLAGLRLVTDQLTLLASTVPTLLVGLGIDYAIYMTQATGERVLSGAAKVDAIAESWATLARPLAVGGLTTSAAFLCLLLARLRGLADLGWAGGFMTLGVLVTSLVLLPVVLSLCPPGWLRRKSGLPEHVGWLGLWVRRHSRVLACSGGLLTAAALVAASRLELQTDNSRLEAQKLPARQLQQRLATEAGLSTAPLVLTFGSRAGAREFARAATTDAVSAAIARVQTVPFAWRTVVVHPAGNPFAERDYQRLMTTVTGLTGDHKVEIAGAPVINNRLTELLRGDWPRVLPAVAAALLAVLAMGFGGLRGALLALVPLACGIAWSAGLLGLTGSLSIMTIAVAPLVLGIGVDDGVHLLHGWRRTGGQLEETFRQTGVPIVATTVTTVIAFGSFAFSATPALVEFGWQAAMGLTFCLLATLLLMPVICMQAPASTQHAPEGETPRTARRSKYHAQQLLTSAGRYGCPRPTFPRRYRTVTSSSSRITTAMVYY
jgi:predicted RND superfamily exporter protein